MSETSHALAKMGPRPESLIEATCVQVKQRLTIIRLGISAGLPLP